MPNVVLTELGGHLNETIVTTGKVFGTRDMSSFVLINIGGVYPNQLLTVLLRGDAKQLASKIADKTIRVTGQLIDYKGKPEIVVNDINLIQIQN